MSAIFLANVIQRKIDECTRAGIQFGRQCGWPWLVCECGREICEICSIQYKRQPPLRVEYND